MKNLISQFVKNEDGVTAIEYAMIGVAMAVLLAAVVGKDGTMGKAIKKAFTDITTNIGKVGTA